MLQDSDEIFVKRIKTIHKFHESGIIVYEADWIEKPSCENVSTLMDKSGQV